MRDLNEGVYIHRKAWEYALAIYGLEQLGAVKDDARAIAVGAGSERPLYYFANRIREMVATDLYDDPDHEGTPHMLESPERFAPFEYRRDHLRVKRMDAAHLEFEDEAFDFAFSLSSIEHFGSRDRIRQAVREMARVVKGDGIVCLIIVHGSDDLQLVGGPLDLRVSRSLVENPIQVDVERNQHVSPHIVLYGGGVLWTSLSLFFRKI
jgi:SAM-dependent methyltransferase